MYYYMQCVCARSPVKKSIEHNLSKLIGKTQIRKKGGLLCSLRIRENFGASVTVCISLAHF